MCEHGLGVRKGVTGDNRRRAERADRAPRGRPNSGVDRSTGTGAGLMFSLKAERGWGNIGAELGGALSGAMAQWGDRGKGVARHGKTRRRE